jgi:ArsR family transcriptional regulator
MPDLSDERTVEVLKALAHPVRLGIIRLLVEQAAFGGDGPSCCVGRDVCVCEITRAFDLSAATISHHLRILREAGLVTADRRGVWIHYAVRPQALTEVAAFLVALADGGLVGATPVSHTLQSACCGEGSTS